MTETWTVQKVLNWTIQHFKSQNISEARLDAELLLADILKCKRVELYLQFERILTVEERGIYREFIKRRVAREPVQYILGQAEFMGFSFKIAPGVFIPRPETELLVDSIYEFIKEGHCQSPQIIEIGSGSGCISISLARLFPQAKISAIEKSADALAIAQENAQLNNVDIHFIKGDFFEQYSTLKPVFNILVSNPPYIAELERETLAPEVREYEPWEALFGGKEGMDFYRKAIPIITKWLGNQSVIFFETGYNQAQNVAGLFRDMKWKVKIKKDYQQIERIVIAYSV